MLEELVEILEEDTLESKILSDKIVLRPKDIEYHPLQEQTGEKTEIVGVFNPGLVQLKNGNLLLVARVAESFYTKKGEQTKKSPRYDPEQKKLVVEKFSNVKHFKNLRMFDVKHENATTTRRVAFTSWLLPIELNSKTLEVEKIHYEKVILPERKLQEFGVEDPRITRIDDKLYMTVIGVSENKVCTYLYELNESTLDHEIKGLIFDHINKDVVLFPKKIEDRYLALTRPASRFINLAYSPDLLYWKPSEFIIAKTQEHTKMDERIGAAAPPVLTKFGWLQLIHGVEHIKTPPKKHKIETGNYRIFSLLLDKDKPYKVLKTDLIPVLEASPELDKQIRKPYLKHSGVVFTTGLIRHNGHFLAASGELDTAIRLTELDIYLNKKQTL